jgi:SAM-dependent methyltransferase
MKILSRIALGAAGVGLAIMAYWRFAVRRRTLPCPSWLSWMLENPFMNTVAGSSAILNQMRLEPGMKVLDVGCGPGRMSVPAAHQVGANGLVVALDLQPAMLRRLRQKMQAEGLTNIRLLQGRADEGALAHDVFDRALLVTVLGEIPDRKAALAEIFRVLKPGGILSITEVLPDPHYQTRHSVRQFASVVGFEEGAHFGGFPAFTIHFVKPGQGLP